MSKLIILTIFLSCSAAILAETCKNPQITSSSFTTEDSTYLTHIAYIAVFEVKCDSNSVIRNLYSEVNGNIAPVSIVGQNKFQVSWTEDPKQSSTGEKLIRIYQEDDIAALRKAQRSGEDISSVPTLGSVVVKYSGAYSGPYIQGELLALLVAGVAAYHAIVSKLQILS